MENTPSPGEFLVLGTLEVLLNQALSMHPQGAASLQQLAGKVIRIRAYDPDYIFYCLVSNDGIELDTAYDGDADVRVRGSAGALIHRALLPPGEAASSPSDIQIDGTPEAVQSLIDTLDTFNLWEAVRTWLREHVAMPEIFGMLRRHDPEWLERLQGMPELMQQTLEEVRAQAEMQRQLLTELRALKESLHNERRTDLLVITAAAALMTLALMTATGQMTLPGLPALEAADQAWVLAVLGLGLLLSRLFARRYE